MPLHMSINKLSCAVFTIVLLSIANDIQANCIAVVTTGGGHQFWQKVQAGARAAANEIETDVYVRGPIDELNFAGQNKLIHQLISRGCKGLVLAPNSNKHQETIDDLKRRGIPTVYIDRDAAGERISVIKTNNYNAGTLAAREMIKALNVRALQNTKVAVFRMQKNIPSTTAREQGFIDTARKAGIEVVADLYLGARVGEARENAFNYLSLNNDLAGIFTPNESTTIGTIRALARMPRPLDLIHIGFDGSKHIVEALKAHTLYGFILQRPFLMGFQGVLKVHSAMQGMMIPEFIETSAVFISRENIDSITVK